MTLPQRSTFETVAPRLALAHRQREEMQAECKRQQRAALGEIVHLEWLVAHRELQLVRAHGRKYIAERQRKLKQAVKTLDRFRNRVPESWEDIAA